MGLGVVVLPWLVFGLFGMSGVGGGWCDCFGWGSIRLALFLSRVMRFSCLVSAFVMGGCSLVLVLLVDGLALGHIVWARRLYPSMVLTTSFAALSIWSVVTWSEPRRFWMERRASCWDVRVLSLPIW